MQAHIYNWQAVPARTLLPGFHGRFVHTERTTLALWYIEPGADLPEHDHPHEQITHIISGTFELTVEGQSTTLKSGDVATIPPHARHSGRALSPCRVLDVFSPRRDDYAAQDAPFFYAGVKT